MAEVVIVPVVELIVNSAVMGERTYVNSAFVPVSLSVADSWRTLVPGGVVSTS